MKKRFSIVAIMIVVLLLGSSVFAGGQQEAAPAADGETLDIVFINDGHVAPYHVAWLGGFEDAIKAYNKEFGGVTGHWLSAEGSLEKMIQFNELLSEQGQRLASNQVTINILKQQRLDEGMIEAGKRMGIRIIARSPLARGILTGKYTPQTLPIGVRARKYSKNELQKIQPLLLTLQTIGAAHAGKTITQTALNWVICKGALPVPGAKTPGQALENIGAVGWQLAVEEVEVLDQISLKVIKELKNER